MFCLSQTWADSFSDCLSSCLSWWACPCASSTDARIRTHTHTLLRVLVHLLAICPCNFVWRCWTPSLSLILFPLLRCILFNRGGQSVLSLTWLTTSSTKLMFQFQSEHGWPCFKPFLVCYRWHLLLLHDTLHLEHDTLLFINVSILSGMGSPHQLTFLSHCWWR